MIVQSFGALQSPRPRYGESEPVIWASSDNYALAPSYAVMYRTQPNVRTVIDFIARNVAQLGLHVFRRVSDTDRKRLFDHELAGWLKAPNPDTTQYRLIEALVQDLGIYGRGYWLKVRGRQRLGLVRLPPETVHVEGWLQPTHFVWEREGTSPTTLAVNDVVYFRYYNPDEPLGGLSNLETLRRLLTEEAAASCFRHVFWQNAARLEGVIERPATVPKWTPEQKQSFREQWAARFSGQPGQTAVLEDGMTFKQMSSTAREAELTLSRKLTREECAAEFHVPLPMVGILEHATFSNIREQHKNLYQDCLGPTNEMIQQEIERQLLPECEDTRKVYVEFNIADKMKGSFEEQASALHTLVGRPVMNVNEGRARLNLPKTNNPADDEIGTPVTMREPGADAPPDEAEKPEPSPADEREERPAAIAADDVVPIIRATWARQRARLAKARLGARAPLFDVARWDRELAADLETVFRRGGADPSRAAQAAASLARSINADTLQLLVARHDAFDGREAAHYVH